MVCVISSLKMGGAERIFAFMANGLAARGYPVTVLTRKSDNGDFFPLAPTVRRVCSASPARQSLRGTIALRFAALLNQRNLRRILLGFKPDCVISFTDHINARVLHALRGTPIPIIISERNNPLTKPVHVPWNIVRRVRYRFAKSLVTPSEDLMGFFAWVRGPEKIVIPNPVARPVVTDAAASLPLQSGKRHIIAMGRLAHQKGFDILLDAFAEIRQHVADVDLIILGDGPDRQLLEQRVAKLGLHDSVQLVGAVKNPADWLSHARVFVLSSRFEGFPNALLEAMSLGIAVVSTDCPTGPREIVQHEQNGLLVPVEDPDALAKAAIRLLSDETLRSALATSAVRVVERFVPERVLDAWEELIGQTVSSHNDGIAERG